MAAKFITVFACFAAFNAVTCQVIQRVVGPAPVAFTEAVYPQYLPNQLIVNGPVLPAPPCYQQAPNVIVDLPGYGLDAVYPALPAYGLDAVYSAPVAVPTIVQDSTVANNLANALQLLIVSNLLSNTLPYMGAPEVIVPSCGCGVDLVAPALPAYAALPPGYAYVY